MIIVGCMQPNGTKLVDHSLGFREKHAMPMVAGLMNRLQATITSSEHIRTQLSHTCMSQSLTKLVPLSIESHPLKLTRSGLAFHDLLQHALSVPGPHRDLLTVVRRVMTATLTVPSSSLIARLNHGVGHLLDTKVVPIKDAKLTVSKDGVRTGGACLLTL